MPQQRGPTKGYPDLAFPTPPLPPALSLVATPLLPSGAFQRRPPTLAAEQHQAQARGPEARRPGGPESCHGSLHGPHATAAPIPELGLAR